MLSDLEKLSVQVKSYFVDTVEFSSGMFFKTLEGEECIAINCNYFNG